MPKMFRGNVLCLLLILAIHLSTALLSANELGRRPGTKMTSEYGAFWSWFQRNEPGLLGFEAHVQETLGEVDEQLEKLHKSLGCEFGPLRDGVREFVVTAHGDKSAFETVRALVSAAPKMKSWTVTAFRQRHGPQIVSFGSVQLKPEAVAVQLALYGDKLAIRLFIQGYSEDRKREFGNAGFLMLDSCLGEVDVETKLGPVEFLPMPNKPDTSFFPVEELADRFDAAYKKHVVDRR